VKKSANSEWRIANRKSSERASLLPSGSSTRGYSLFAAPWPAVVGLVVLALGLWLFFVLSVDAHDSWISRGSLRNGAGEWCCGEGDCFVVPSDRVSARADGYHVVVTPDENPGAEHVRLEVVPYAEAQPSPDGGYWRCKRPDGSRRCFFAPPPNT
jgi:hypothetical protein